MQEEKKLRLRLLSEEPTKSAHWRKCASRKQVERELCKDTTQAPEQHSASYLLCRAMSECQMPEREADALGTGSDESVLQRLVPNPAESIGIVPPVCRRDSMGYVCWRRCSRNGRCSFPVSQLCFATMCWSLSRRAGSLACSWLSLFLSTPGT